MQSFLLFPRNDLLIRNLNSGFVSSPELRWTKLPSTNSTQAIAGYNHDDGTRRSVLGAANLADDNKAPHDAVNLNNLDDWTEFHQAELK